MATWSVLVEARSPDEGDTLAEDDPAIGRFFDLLWPEYGAAVSAGGLYWSARISIGVDDVLEVFPTAVTIVEKAATHAGLPDWPIVRAELVTDDEIRMQLEVPNFPVVMGTAEVVERLGVSRQRLTELRASRRFPEPLLTLAATPVWLASAVNAFVETWDRSPGRRKLVAPKEIHDSDADDTWVDEMERRS
jgi:hypothetical protein